MHLPAGNDDSNFGDDIQLGSWHEREHLCSLWWQIKRLSSEGVHKAISNGLLKKPLWLLLFPSACCHRLELPAGRSQSLITTTYDQYTSTHLNGRIALVALHGLLQR